MLIKILSGCSALQIHSVSSALMLANTLSRNNGGSVNRLVGQVGYALIVLIAIVETAIALVFSALSLAIYPYSPKPFEYATTWLSSSAFSVGWSLTDFIMNLFVLQLVADEKSARKILQQGNLMLIPRGAIV